MPRGTQEKARFGLYCKPHRGFAERTWYFSRDARDKAYDRAKANAGEGKQYSYVKKVQR